MVAWHLSLRIPFQKRFIIGFIIAQALLSPLSCLGDSDVDTEVRPSDGSCSCGGQRDIMLGQLNNGKGEVLDATSSTTKVIETDHVFSSLLAIARNDSTNQSRITSVNSTKDSTDLLGENDMVYISGGLYFMGTNDPFFPRDGEGPRRLVNLSDFMIDRLKNLTRVTSAFIAIEISKGNVRLSSH